MESKIPQALSNNAAAFAIVVPKAAPPGAKRFLIFGGPSGPFQGSCGGILFQYKLDPSKLKTERRLLVERFSLSISVPLCHGISPLFAQTFAFALDEPGDFSIEFKEPVRDPTPGSLTTLLPTKVADVSSSAQLNTSAFEVSGHWIDPATNGSGIAIQHRRTPETFLGTWFMYGSRGETKWMSLQFTEWSPDGKTVSGLLFTLPNMQCVTPGMTTSLHTCPNPSLPVQAYFPAGTRPEDPLVMSPFNIWNTALATLTFSSPTRAHAEVRDLAGTLLFTSELQKLDF
jgi:hypothetical protein